MWRLPSHAHLLFIFSSRSYGVRLVEQAGEQALVALDESPISDFSVFLLNIWGTPQQIDKSKVTHPLRVKAVTATLRHELEQLDPWVIGLVEYDKRHFDRALQPIWDKYSECQMEANAITIGVRKGVKCRRGHTESFGGLPGCVRGARSYQSVEIEVNNTWVTVAVLHLASGISPQIAKCRQSSLGKSFQLARKHGPAVVIGDMNWFGWPQGIHPNPPDGPMSARPDWALQLEKDESDKIASAGGRVRKGADVKKAAETIAPMQLHFIADSEHYADPSSRDNYATFPAWEPDLHHPLDEFAGRLDRGFHTKGNLKATGFKLVNPRVTHHKDPKFDYMSDHAGLYYKYQTCSSFCPPSGPLR